MYETNDDNVFLDGGIPDSENTSKNEETDDYGVSAQIAKLVIEIANDKGIDDNHLQYIYNRLYNLYSKGNRHSYSVISATIQQNMKAETGFIARLQINMETFLQLAQKNLRRNEVDRNIEASFNKLYDHVMLECNRMGYIAEISKNLEMQQKVLNKQVKSTVRDVKKLYADLIGIVSIFVAIFALITVNANITFKLTTTNMNEIFWGIIVVNIVVVLCIIVLLYAVRKIIIDELTKEG